MSLMSPGKPSSPRRSARPRSNSGTLLSARIEDWKAQWAALDPEDRRFGLVRGIGVLILLGIPLLLFMRPESGIEVEWPGGRWVWTAVIAMLPLAIVVMGFYTWRRICPLAFFGRLGEWIGWPDRPGTRESERRRIRVPESWARRYPYVTWGFLATMLALRLLLINSNSTALALTFVGLILLATLTSFRYTGKTWCNFFCPVFTIELLYTEGDKPQYKRNSQCAACTGCKTVPSGGLCPDINQENDYWQEIKLPGRAFSYYAFPGLVLGFYLWYFLHQPYFWHQRQGQVIRGELVPVQQPGSVYDWGYYLSGDWTRDPRPWTHWLEPGFGLHGWPYVPTLLAAPLTLALFAALSYVLFKGMEALWFRARVRQGETAEHALEAVRHPLFAWAGFTAFTIFYSFAGAPTLRYLPLSLYSLFHFGIVVLAAWVLHTRLSRTRAKQLQFDQARKWVKKWPFPEEAPPADLDEAYMKYTLRMQFSEDRLRAFKEAVRQTLGENLITVAELNLLDRLALDLGVNEVEQTRVLKEISREAPEFFDPKYQGTLRDRLHLIGYRSELERALSQNKGVLPDAAVLAEMQARYRLQPPEHEEVMRELRDPQGPRAEHLRREVEEIQQMRRDAVVLAAYPAPSLDFLLLEVERSIHDDGDHVLQMANLYGPAGELDGLRAALRQPDGGATARQRAADWVRRHLPATLAAAVVDAVCAPNPLAQVDTSPAGLTQVLLRLSQDPDFYVRAAALYSLRLVLGVGIANPAHCREEDRAAARLRAEAALQDPHSLLVETAVAVLAPNLSPQQWAAVLQDPSVAVRRAAINRVPCPVPAELQGLVSQACNDRDERIRLAALALHDNLAPRLPNGQPLPGLTTPEKMFALRSAEFLACLPAERLHFLAERTEEDVFEAGEALCTEGDAADSVYILIEGQAEVVKKRDGREVRLGVCKQRECVGEMAVLGDPAPRFATVRVLDGPVRVLTVFGDDFRSLLGGDPTASLGVMRLIIARQHQDLPAA